MKQWRKIVRKMDRWQRLLWSGAVLGATAVRAATPATVTIDVAHPGVAISPMLNGLMTEEINHAYDGGLYAELIRNRNFLDDAKHPDHWSIVGNASDGTLSLDRDGAFNAAHPVSLRFESNGTGSIGIANDGYWGIPVKPDTTYTATIVVKGGGLSGPLTLSIQGDDGVNVVEAKTEPLTNAWQTLTATMKTAADAKPSAKNKFVITAPAGKGTLNLAMVSLFPPTYMNRPNGLRPDLMKLMDAMHPAFLRMPGGNYLEGDTFPTRFDWKKMIGPVIDRAGHMGCWSYRSSDGFGLPEFLTWCEQLHIEPVLAVFAGYTLNHDHVNPGPKLQPYVDEALEEIEYCTGDATTEWGKRRAEDGHAEPFNIHYVEIGNEDWFDKSGSYDGRYAQFYEAIKAKYPQLQLIATAGVKKLKPDVVDDHYYYSANWMMAHSDRYDKTDRNGPKIFVGEWATQEGRPTPNMNAAIGDAVWLMGLERNSDVVVMQSYAPLFVNVNPKAWQWPTNLIGYDAQSAFGSPSYWMQVMFGQNQGDRVLPTQAAAAAVVTTAEAPHGRIGVGTWHTTAEYSDISVTSPDGKTLMTADLSKDTRGWTIDGGQWSTQDNAIKQTTADSTTTAVIGDPGWTDYTLHLKARKTGGKEGFLILVRSTNDDSFVWWNVGGWGNTKTGLEVSESGTRENFGKQVNFKIEAGKTYDLKVEVAGNHVKCFADDKLINEADITTVTLPTTFYATATQMTASHEVIVKLVNAGKDAVDANITLNGANHLQSTGMATVLTSASPRDVNTVDEPQKVVPHEESLTGVSANFHRELPPHSVTLLRLKNQ